MNSQPKIVLGIAAHPDDLDFYAGGTLATYAAAGAAVHYLILTDGSKGSAEPIDPAELAAARLKEQEAACQLVGGSSVTTLGYADGELEVTMALKHDIVKVIRQLKPDTVITFNPAELYTAKYGQINHSDHRAAGQASLDAVYPLARDHLAFERLAQAGYEPHKVSTVLLMSFENHNFYVDIGDKLAVKQQAMLAHTSQVKNPDEMAASIKNLALDIGKTADCQYAEGFTRIDINV